MSEQGFYIGCLVCGIHRNQAKSNLCYKDRAADYLIPGHELENVTHQWSEIRYVKKWYGHSIIDILEK